jgi:hypothetical protein
MGGVTYSSGVLTVPSDGAYYIYAQIFFHPVHTGSNYVTIQVNGSRIVEIYFYMSSTSDDKRNKYSGFVRQLRKGDRVHLQGHGYRYYMDPVHSFFGLWKIG